MCKLQLKYIKIYILNENKTKINVKISSFDKSVILL